MGWFSNVVNLVTAPIAAAINPIAKAIAPNSNIATKGLGGEISDLGGSILRANPVTGIPISLANAAAKQVAPNSAAASMLSDATASPEDISKTAQIGAAVGGLSTLGAAGSPSGAASLEYGQPGYGQTPQYGQAGWTESMANGGVGLGGAALGGAASGGATSSGLGTLGRALGGLAGPTLGYLGSKDIAGQQNQLAQQYMAMGAPYRGRLADLYSNPESFLSSKEVTTPVQQGSDIMARSLSTRGNPVGSGNALQQLQSYATDQLYGRLGQEKDRLAGFGGLSQYNQAAPQQASNAIGSQANTWNAIGAGAGALNDIFNPPKQSGYDRYWESLIK